MGCIFMYITLEDDGNPYHRVLGMEVIEEEIAKLNNVGDGAKLMRYLAMVGRADNLAQNPAMTDMSLRLLDKIDCLCDDKELEMR